MQDSILLADGFDDALVGISSNGKAVYDVEKCIKVLESQGMDYEDAVDFFYFTVEGAFTGKNTPIWIHTGEKKTELLEDYGFTGGIGVS